MSYPQLLDRLLPREAPPRNGLRLASFFCCAGGIDLGFRSAGFELAFANDISRHAVETFERNLGHRPVHRDIREVGKEDYPEGAIDVLTGGFPCVTFSTAGRRLGVTDDLNGKLYLELCRVISEVKPRYFVAENVKGLLSANGGAAPKLVLAAFLRLGYRTAFQLVNMAEHGVPQTRERVVFVGVRLDQWRGEFRFPPRTHRLRGDKSSALPTARSLLEAIGDLPPPGERVVGVMHADSAHKRRSDGLSTYHNSKPRSSSSSHSQTSSGPNVLVVNHEPNTVPPRDYNIAARYARRDAPAPTTTSHDDTSAPFVLTGHEKNGTPPYSMGITRRFAPAPAPAPAMVSTSNDVPFVTNHEANGSPVSKKHEMSKRFAPSPSPSPSPTIVSEAANVQPIIAARNADFKNKRRSSSSSSVAIVSSEPPEALTAAGLRRMTVRECARVQSFPDWFEFPAQQGEAYRLVGNAVPPLYARRLAEALVEYDRRRIVK